MLQTGIADQSGSGVTIIIALDAPMATGLPFYWVSDGGVNKANANTTATVPAMGVTLFNGATGATGLGLVHGVYRDDSVTYSTVGGPVYLGASAGTLTQTQPSSTDQVIQVVGVALTSHILYVDPQLDYLTHT